ncbi:hypothetical protein HOLleu_33691 [Holothuria leucospilota]|uniref:ZU5 domain-containing protein n=1 Tax=Holothuria leucospilota TaxID=206669 RepID=A0A9Q0YST9_HOLLE|nr:hypothetical protein HOLleu_33691 [Holothuria leucospilota]
MTKRVKEGLETFFDIPELKGGGRFEDDNLAFCNLLKEKGLISPLHIEIFTTALNECGQQSVVKFVDLLFVLFKFGDLDTSNTEEDEKEGDFQRFLDMLSLLMTNEVREGLKSFFDIPEAQTSVVQSSNVAFCKVLHEKGIINPLHLELLTTALEECGQQSVKRVADTLFELFKFGKLGIPILLKRETEPGNFQRFLDILALLMTNEVKEGLASFFEIPEVNADDLLISDNVAYCNLLKEKGIISTMHVDLFITTMLECGQRSVAKISHTLFNLFEKGKLGTSSSLKEEKEREFQIFLDVLLLLMTKEVKEGLKSFFHIPEVQVGGVYEDNDVAFCSLLEDKGIISPVYNELLKTTLVECGQEGVGTFSDTLCQLFKEGKLGALITLEEEKDFRRFLEYLSSVMTDGVKWSIVSFFKFPSSDIDNIIHDNIKFCNHLKERHIISPKYISPLIHGLDVVKKDRRMCRLFNNETCKNRSLMEFKEELEAFIQEISDHFTMFTSSIKMGYSDKSRTSTVSRDSTSEAPSNVQSPPKNQHQKDTDMMKSGQNERQQQIETHKNFKLASLCTSAELSLDFGQHQMFNNVDTDDTSYDEPHFFSRAGDIHCLEATTSISKEGGNIEIPYTGVELQIRPDSFLREDEVHLITVKILPRRLFDEAASCFEDHSTVMVEILPNNLKLQRPAKLTLPHCLILKDPKNCDVKIFHSHHDPGGKESEGKKLFLYTLGKRYTRNSKFVTAEVGYFPALPGNDMIKLEDADFITSSKGTVSFYLFKRPTANLECYWYFLTKL